MSAPAGSLGAARSASPAGSSGVASAATPDFAAELKAFEGRSVGEGTWSRDPVNAPMIRHWVEAMGDANPIYTDEGAARDAGHEGIVAPPTMLQAWGMRGLAPFDPPPGEGADEQTAFDEIMAKLNDAGFTSVVATNCDQTYDRYLRPGEELCATATIDSVSDEKTTGLGTGHFVTTRTDYTTRGGEHVGAMTFRILKFRPKEK